MKKLKTLVKNNPIIFLVIVYILVHLVFFSVNVAEWGDSYRILRASLFIDERTYPVDEKRPPLFSALIAFFPQNPDPVFWGRLTVFFVGLGCFILFLKLLEYFIKLHSDPFDLPTFFLGGLLFLFNPVFFYWSIRVMADSLFVFFVLLAFCAWYLLKESSYKPLLLGLIAGFAVLTRFEGYLLFGTFGLVYGIEFLKTKGFKNLVIYVFASLLLVLPYFFWRNPLTSSYLAEPAGRAYDLQMVLIFVVSFLFMFGFPSAVAFLGKPSRALVTKHFGLSVFILVDLLLILLWPAAIPRLFMPVIPFFLIFITLGISSYFSLNSKNLRIPLVMLGLTLLYLVSQYLLKLQFLVVLKPFFVLVLILSLLSTIAAYKKSFKLFFSTVLLSTIIWTSSTVYIHRELYLTTKEVMEYAVKNASGYMIHNDTASIVEWYLNDLYPNDPLIGSFSNLDNNRNLDYNSSVGLGKVDYILVTNEEKPQFTFEPDENKFELILRKENFTNGALFYTELYKVK